MNVNYDILFSKAKEQYPNGKKLLLQVCCAPCATYCLTQLIDKFDVTLFFANDNITDQKEWEKRLGEVKKLVDIVNGGEFEVKPLHPLKLVVPEYDSAKFFAAAMGLEQEKEGGARCAKCFNMRLECTKQYALLHDFDLFGSTLSVSPYKNSQLLNQTGIELQTDELQWLPSDFKKHGGYYESIRLSQKYGLYRQHYCGCVFSQPEEE